MYSIVEDRIDELETKINNTSRTALYSEQSGVSEQLTYGNYQLGFADRRLYIRDVSRGEYITINIPERDLENISSIIFSDSSQIRGITSDINLKSDTLAASIKAVNSITIDIDGIRLRLTIAENDIDSLKNRTAKVENDVNLLTIDYNAFKDNVEEEQLEQNERISEQRNISQTLILSVSTLESTTYQHSSQISDLENTTQEQTSQISQLETKTQEHSSQISQLETKTQEQTSQISTLANITQAITYDENTSTTNIPKINIDSISTDGIEIWNKSDLTSNFAPNYPRLLTLKSDGVVEVGRYLDFRQSASAITDYNWRITASNNLFEISGGLFNPKVYLGLSSSGITSPNFTSPITDLNSLYNTITVINTITQQHSTQISDLETLFPVVEQLDTITQQHSTQITQLENKTIDIEELQQKTVKISYNENTNTTSIDGVLDANLTRIVMNGHALLTPNAFSSNYTRFYPAIPLIKSDGVTELGEFIDMHSNDVTGFDMIWRLQARPNTFNFYNYMEGDVYNTVSYIGQDGTYYKTSDRKFKSNIELLKDEDADKVLKLNPCKYIIKNHCQIGLIAQEVQEIIPEIVNEQNEILSLDYSGLIPYLIKTVQKLEKRIKILEQK